jgi:hypothetical protein
MDMRFHHPMRVLRFVLLAALAIAAAGLLVMGLWNWLLPTLFGWRQIGFAEALGLLLLSRILFGRFGRHGCNAHGRGHFQERWAMMTPEEREKFRAGMRGNCGQFAAAEPGQEART